MADDNYRTDLSFSIVKKALTRTTLNLADNFNAIFEQLFSNDARLKESIDKMKTDGVKANGGNADTLGGKGISYFAKDGHKHQKADIEGFPEKLPADGGNADTVAGKKPGTAAGNILVLDGQGKVPKENQYDAEFKLYWKAQQSVGTGEVRFPKDGPTWSYLVCTQAGTTGSSEPEILTADSIIVDGSAKWLVRSLGNTGLASYPVGSIYMSTVATSPADLFGGTWEAMPAGRVLLAQGTSEWGVEYKAGSTGGEHEHQLSVGELPAHKHTANINTAGSHNHTFGSGSNGGSDNHTFDIGWGEHSINIGNGFNKTYYTTDSGSHFHTIVVDNSGGNTAHNNLQPYLAVYCWKRTV
mgnify:CR=1 FL=1